MKWASSIYGPEALGRSRDELGRAVQQCSEALKKELGDNNIDLVVGFIAPHFADYFDDVPELVEKALGAKVFIGCSAGGSIGGGQEVERKACVAFTAASLPDVEIRSFHVTDQSMPDLDGPPEAWEKLIGVKNSEQPSLVLLPDPFSVRSDDIIRGLDYAFPQSVKIGGLASGAREPGGNALFLNRETHRKGIVGIALIGNVQVDTVVAQGCKPIGHPCRVTKSSKHVLFELDGEPAVMVLRKIMSELSDFDRDLAREAMFLGLVMHESDDGHKAGDFLIRNILGIEQTTGALVIGEMLDQARTVQFHVRDAATSADDLRFLLKRYRDEKLDGAADKVKGALLFSCLGRGVDLYGRANHDSECFHSYLGAVPLGGFFCNGEIGPVGNNTYLHGYTSSFGIFRQKQGC